MTEQFTQIKKYVQENDVEQLLQALSQTPFDRENDEHCNEWGEILTLCTSEKCLSLLDQHAGEYYREWGWNDIIWSGIDVKQMNMFITYIREKGYLTPKQWGGVLRALIEDSDQEQTANLRLVTSYVKEDTKRRRAHNKVVDEATEALKEYSLLFD